MVSKFFGKRSTGIDIKNEIKQNQQLEMNFINQLLENLNKEKFILHLKKIFVV